MSQLVTRPPMRGQIRGRRGLVTIVIPAKDEEAAIGDTLQSLPVEILRAMGFGVEVLLLDGNSRDATCAIARRHGAHILQDPEPGKGAAFRHARPHFRGDYIVMLDADGTYAPETIPEVISRLAWSEAEVVMGRRRPQPGAMKTSHRVGNALLSFGASVLYGRRCHDLCTGLWGFRRDVLQALPLCSRGFELEAELFSLASRLGFRIAEVPVEYRPRKGETKLSAMRDGAYILRCLLRSRFVSVGHRRGLQRATTVPESPMGIEVLE